MFVRAIGYVVVGWILWELGKKAYLEHYGQPTSEGKTDRSRTTTKPQYINMTRCDYCGLNFPKAEMITQDQKAYCCKEHAKLALRDED